MTKPPRRLNLLDRPKAARGTTEQREDDGDGWDGLAGRHSDARTDVKARRSAQSCRLSRRAARNAEVAAHGGLLLFCNKGRINRHGPHREIMPRVRRFFKGTIH